MPKYDPPQGPTVVFRNNVPDLFLVHSLERLVKAYALATDDVTAGYQAPEAHDLLGHVVRAKFEGFWRALGKMEAHKASGIEPSVERNRRGTSNFTVMRSGIAAMTASATDDPSTVVRFAAFRNVFAEPQAGLFQSLTAPRRVTAIYGILLHGRESRRNPSQVGFARVVFPMVSQWKGHIVRYHHEQVDLLREFGSVVDAVRGAPEEQVLDSLRIELKKQKGIG